MTGATGIPRGSAATKHAVRALDGAGCSALPAPGRDAPPQAVPAPPAMRTAVSHQPNRLVNHARTPVQFLPAESTAISGFDLYSVVRPGQDAAPQHSAARNHRPDDGPDRTKRRDPGCTTSTSAACALPEVCTTSSTREAIPGTGIVPAAFWAGFGALVARPRAAQHGAAGAAATRCRRRSTPGTCAHRGRPIDQAAYVQFLRDIGYLQPEPPTSPSPPPTSMPRSPASPARSLSCRSPTPATR